MTKVRDLYGRMVAAMGVEGLTIPTACVKIYKQGDEIPAGVRDCEPEGITLTSCQSARQAGFGDSVLLTSSTIGCVAAAISFGLVDKNQDKPLGDSTVYTDIMKQQAADADGFVPPSPKDFSDGTVYAWLPRAGLISHFSAKMIRVASTAPRPRAVQWKT